MKKSILAFLLIVWLTPACSTVSHVKILETPRHKTNDQRKIDGLECRIESKTVGPLLFGIGPIIYRNRAKNKFCNCMESRGYVVEH